MKYNPCPLGAPNLVQRQRAAKHFNGDLNNLFHKPQPVGEIQPVAYVSQLAMNILICFTLHL